MNSVMTGLDSIPETAIAVSVYLLGSAIILWCWYEIAKRLPNPLGGITWIVLFAIFTYPNSIRRRQCSTCPSHLWASFWLF